jgi:hypothetical protein
MPEQEYRQGQNKHEDADPVNAVHHSEVEIAGFMSPSRLEDLYEIVQESVHLVGTLRDGGCLTVVGGKGGCLIGFPACGLNQDATK